jgi:shikimate kinase
MGKRIYLIGFMGSGKSTAGRRLARLLGYSFTDLDAMIESKYHITIPDIFNRYDEAAFRKVEHETLKETFALDDHVISTGGGTPCFFNNIEIINKHGTSVYLEMHPRSLYTRLMNSKKRRPLIDNRQPDEVLAFIGDELNKREVHYRKAHHIVKGENLDVQELLTLLSSKLT